MSISWFCVWQGAAGQQPKIDPYDLNGLQALVCGCPGLVEGHILVSTTANDPYYKDAKGAPSLIMQLEFREITLLEACLRRDGYLACLADSDYLPSLTGATPAQQAMLTRRYPVKEPVTYSASETSLSYWVEYPGPAENENEWHVFYTNHHPHLLAKFPGIRKIEIYTPAVSICDLPIPVRPSMQRNKTVFDSVEAMNEAMQSPVRDALRKDFHKFPKFEGVALHFPYNTYSYVTEKTK